mgnify:CR=1 FL=1
MQTRLIQKEEDGCAASEEDAAGQEWNVGIALWEQIKREKPQVQSLFSSAGRTGGLSPCVILQRIFGFFPTTARRKMMVKQLFYRMLTERTGHELPGGPSRESGHQDCFKPSGGGLEGGKRSAPL